MIFKTFFVQRTVAIGLTIWLTNGLMARTVRITVFIYFASNRNCSKKIININTNIVDNLQLEHSLVNILRTHSISLPPVNPAGHEQCLTWLKTLQLAFNPHDPCRSHGLLHCPCKHCSDRPHSASDWQDALKTYKKWCHQYLTDI